MIQGYKIAHDVYQCVKKVQRHIVVKQCNEDKCSIL